MLKKVAKIILPNFLYLFFKKNGGMYKAKNQSRKVYQIDKERYLRYSETLDSNSSNKLIGRILREYHVVEKGLTMPNTRFGFGKDVMLNLIKDCIQHIDRYGANDEQLIHAIGVILEYQRLHEDINFELEHEINEATDKLKRLNVDAYNCPQIETTKTEYFKYTNSIFSEFSKSRSSVRNFSNENISIEMITKAFELARTTPSSCNRQCARTYLFKDEKQIAVILDLQGGNRGFGHLANKLIIITSELGGFNGLRERNAAFIDGGMYAMNLLYAIHFQQIAACPLNCSLDMQKEKTLRKYCNIKDSEVFIMMIACGIPPENFKTAISKRYKLDKTHTIIE